MKFINNKKQRRRKVSVALMLMPTCYISSAFAQQNIQINNLVDTNFEVKEKAVSKIINETGADVLNVTDQKNEDGKSTLKFKIIKDGKVQIIEQKP